MEHEKPPPYVQYHSSDPSIKFVEPEEAPSHAPMVRGRRCRCTATRCLVFAVTIFLMAVVATLSTLLFFGRFEPSPKAGHLSTGLHGITNLSLVAVDNRYVTMTWNKPLGGYDFYLVDVTGGSGEGYNTLPQHYAGSCANGTIVRADQTQITCGPFPACSSITFTVSTFSKGPPEHISMGATLKDVFVSGKDPSEPGGITMVPKTPYTTQIQWEPPTSLDGTIDVYKVTVCEKSTTCANREKLTGCVEHEVSETWLDFDSTADTSYCVLVSASSRCGVDVLIGPPAVQEIRTPLFELPDVSNLNLVAVDNNYVTVAWDQPRDSFDFYWLDVTDGGGYRNGSPGKLRVGACGNGTLIRPQQTQISCGPFDACSSVNITVHTFSHGPPELVSTGTTLNSIFIGGKEPSEPRSLTMLAESPSTTRFRWEMPASFQGTFRGYKVQVCKVFKACSRNDTLDGCVEFETSDSWLDVGTTPDTQYCVVVTAAVRCGPNVLYSTPVTRGVKTPLFALPDVSNLSAAVLKSGYITLSWQRPGGRFDHYSVEVMEHAASIAGASQKRHGSCANVIIRPYQTELTCGPFEPCTNLSCTIRTHVNGPPDHSSPGASVIGIFIPLEDPSPPGNVTMIPESSSRTRLSWSPSERNAGILDSYSLKICNTTGSCYRPEALKDCVEHTTTDAWTVFDSRADTSYCVLISAKTRCGADWISSRQATAHIRTPLFDLPDVTDFRLLKVADNSITVAWKRPEARFDYYWVSVTEGNDNDHGNDNAIVPGSCVNGTIIHPDHNRVTCTNLDACTAVNITLRTHRNGPPEHTSRGASLQDIFIPGEEPDPPRNISVVGQSPSLTQLHWESSSKVSGKFLEYAVTICTTFKSCNGEANVSGCTELSTYRSWLEFPSSADTVYCVMVRTRSQCGKNILNSRPAMTEIRTPVFVTPEVTNLRLVSVGAPSLTAAWERPKGNFDYYWIEIMGSDSHQQGVVGSCANGTIIHPDQTQVTCAQLKPCSKVDFKVRTHVKGPPTRTSSGKILKDIFIPDSVPAQVTRLKVAAVRADTFVLRWERLNACFDYYTVEVIDETTGSHSGVKCNNDTRINASQTSVTCDQTESCANVTIRMTRHSRGPPERSSTSTVLKHVLLPGKAPADVTNLKVATTGADNFTLTWVPPKACFDFYTVEVIDEGTGGYSGVKCNNGLPISSSQSTVTCEQIETCANVTIRVATHTRGTDERSSAGTVLEHVLLRGKAGPPELTNVLLATAYEDNFTITFQAPYECLDSVYVTVKASGNRKVEDAHKSCTYYKLGYSKWKLTCKNIPACERVDVTVGSLTDGPPQRYGPGVKVRGINARGSCRRGPF